MFSIFSLSPDCVGIVNRAQNWALKFLQRKGFESETEAVIEMRTSRRCLIIFSTHSAINVETITTNITDTGGSIRIFKQISEKLQLFSYTGYIHYTRLLQKRDKIHAQFYTKTQHLLQFKLLQKSTHPHGHTSRFCPHSSTIICQVEATHGPVRPLHWKQPRLSHEGFDRSKQNRVTSFPHITRRYSNLPRNSYSSNCCPNWSNIVI